MPQLEYVIKGLKRSATYSISRTRLPITPELLRTMKTVWQAWDNHRDAAMLWATVTMCFCGFLRSGEVVVPSQSGYDPYCHLSYGDVLVDNMKALTFLEVRIKASKTDPFRKGVSVFSGMTGSKLCPVAANLDYMIQRGSQQGPSYSPMDPFSLENDSLVP